MNLGEMVIVFWGGGVWADYQNLLVVWVLEKIAMVIEWNVVGVWYLVKKVKVKEYLIHFEESYQNLLLVWVLEKKVMVIERKVVGVWYLVKKVQRKVERM